MDAKSFDKRLKRFGMSVQCFWNNGWRYRIVDAPDGTGIPLCLYRDPFEMDKLISRMEIGDSTDIYVLELELRKRNVVPELPLQKWTK